MIKGVVKKIFFSTAALFLFIMLFQLLIQNFLLDDIYVYTKKSKIEKNLKEMISDYENENWNKLKLEKSTKEFSNENDASVLVINQAGEVVNNNFFKDFNYLVVKTVHGKYMNIIIDYFVDEEGNQRYDSLNFTLGERVKIKGIEIKGSDWIEPIEVIYNNKTYNDDRIMNEWNEFYGRKEEIIQHIEGEIVYKNYVSRTNGTLSYQENKLWTEIKVLLKEEQILKEPNKLRENEREYSFIEEGSGLEIAVFNDYIKKKDGSLEFIFVLVTLENIRNVFKTLNSYYLYLLAFVFLMILVLSYFYSKWITKPMLHLNEVAKSIANLNFTKKSEIKSNDELQELSDNLNSISDNLNRTIKKLKNSNQILANEAHRKAEEEKRMRNLLASLSHEKIKIYGEQGRIIG